MAASRAYYTLMTSLPYLPPLFRNTRVPISRLRLDQRLRMLYPPDREALADIEAIYSWHDRGKDESEIARVTETMTAKLKSPMIRGLVEDRLALRTVINALRRRKRGGGPPRPGQRWGFVGLTGHIVRNWGVSDFRLTGRMPELPEIRRMLETDQSLELEKLLMARQWNALNRAAERHLFNFEAVALYVMRWLLIDRWTGYNRARGLARFDELTADALAQMGPLFDEAGAPRADLVHERDLSKERET